MNKILVRIFQSFLENLPRENLVPDIDNVNRWCAIASHSTRLCSRPANRFAICLCQPGCIVVLVSVGQGSEKGLQHYCSQMLKRFFVFVERGAKRKCLRDKGAFAFDKWWYVDILSANYIPRCRLRLSR